MRALLGRLAFTLDGLSALARARLEQRDRESEALEGQADALTAKDEAQRLQDEATKKKAARKSR